MGNLFGRSNLTEASMGSQFLNGSGAEGCRKAAS